MYKALSKEYYNIISNKTAILIESKFLPHIRTYCFELLKETASKETVHLCIIIIAIINLNQNRDLRINY